MRNFNILSLLLLAVLWSGLLLGVSFLATPVKFVAPSLSLPVALDVGRQTFMVFNWLEVALGLMLVVFTVGTARRWMQATAVTIALIVAMQTIWLLPVLDARVQVILDGSTPPASVLHMIYIVADALKLTLLGILVWRICRLVNQSLIIK
ncbi:hypothetical protein [Pseudohongiella sp.]|uniref:DUF4149 domain-containing protein n=1 Tax=marine sediment metagenome TaxID=412755 RepID=A0A0F9WJF7_9ZZZZ|nr:hypothetical protein [Pseudohongiella sp.]